MELTLPQIVTLLRDTGGWALAALLAYGGMRGWFVFRPTHEDIKRERDENKALLLQALRITKDAIHVTRQP